MSHRENLQNLLNDFVRSIGLEELALDPNGLGTLLFDDKIMLHVQVNEMTGMLMLFATVGTVPDHCREDFYADMLQGNLFWQQTGGATLALEKSAQAAVLVYEHALSGLDQPGFQGMIKQFIDVVEDWQERLQEASAEHRRESAIDATAMPSGEQLIRV